MLWSRCFRPWVTPAGLLCGALAAGCQAPGPEAPSYPPPRMVAGAGQRSPAPPLEPTQKPIRQVVHAEPSAISDALSLNDLLALAQARNPDLVTAAARVGEAHGRMIQAGLYPNPTVGYSANQINDGPGTPGQQGGFVSQEFVTGGKLRIAREAARFGVSAADWNAVSKWYDTVARVKAAYYEYLTAAAVLRETEATARLFEEALSRTEKLSAGGKVESYDVTRLRVETTQAHNRVGTAWERLAAGARMLAVAVGVDSLPAGVAGDALPDTAPVPGFAEAVATAGRSSFVLAPAADAEQAKTEVRQAEVKPVPNVTAMATVAYDYVTRAPMASVQVGVPVPVFDRNQGAVIAARFRYQAAVTGVEQARLRAVERLTAAYQRYENARRQLELYRTRVLPDAAAALEQIDAIYAAKGERFFDTIDARRVLAQARIDYAQAIGDLWTAVTEIETITQQPVGAGNALNPVR